ncbi:MAG: hypothetical protein ACXWC0_15140 [Burkholderiales bacterium]
MAWVLRKAAAIHPAAQHARDPSGGRLEVAIVKARPYEYEFAPAATALIVIDLATKCCRVRMNSTRLAPSDKRSLSLARQLSVRAV